jgi:hypothetical protein
VIVYVGYRIQHPDEETVEIVRQELKEHNIDINKLLEWPTNHCQLPESPKLKGMGFGKQTSAILNNLYN